MAKNNTKKKAKRDKRERQQTSDDTADSMRKQGRGDIVSDVLGGYTGTASDGGAPEQDGGDL